MFATMTTYLAHIDLITVTKIYLTLICYNMNKLKNYDQLFNICFQRVLRVFVIISVTISSSSPC